MAPLEQLTEKSSRTKKELQDLITQIHDDGILTDTYIMAKSRFSVYPDETMKGKKKTIIPKDTPVKVLDSKMHNGNLRLRIEYEDNNGNTDTGFIYVVFKGGETTFKIDTQKQQEIDEDTKIAQLEQKISDLEETIKQMVEKKDLDAAQAQILELQTQLTELSQENTSLVEKNKELQASLSSLNNFIDTVKQVSTLLSSGKSKADIKQIIESAKIKDEHKTLLLTLINSLPQTQTAAPEIKEIGGKKYIKVDGKWRELGQEIDIEKLESEDFYKKLGYEYIGKTADLYLAKNTQQKFVLFKKGETTPIIYSDIEPKKLTEGLYIIQWQSKFSIINIATTTPLKIDGNTQLDREPKFGGGNIIIGDKKYTLEGKLIADTPKGNPKFTIAGDTISYEGANYKVIGNIPEENILIGVHQTGEIFIGDTSKNEKGGSVSVEKNQSGYTIYSFTNAAGKKLYFVLGAEKLLIGEGKNFLFDTYEIADATIYLYKNGKKYGIDNAKGTLTEIVAPTPKVSREYSVGETISGLNLKIELIIGNLYIGKVGENYGIVEKGAETMTLLNVTKISDVFLRFTYKAKEYILDIAAKKLLELVGTKTAKDTKKEFFVVKDSDTFKILAKDGATVGYETESPQAKKALLGEDPEGLKILFTLQSNIGAIIVLKDNKLIDIIDGKKLVKISDAFAILQSIDGKRALTSRKTLGEINTENTKQFLTEIGDKDVKTEQIGTTGFYKLTSSGEKTYIFDSSKPDIVKFGTGVALDKANISEKGVKIGGVEYTLSGELIQKPQVLKIQDGKITTENGLPIDWSKVENKKSLGSDTFVIKLDGKIIVTKLNGEIIPPVNGIYTIEGKKQVFDTHLIRIVLIDKKLADNTVAIKESDPKKQVIVLVNSKGEIILPIKVRDTGVGEKTYEFTAGKVTAQKDGTLVISGATQEKVESASTEYTFTIELLTGLNFTLKGNILSATQNGQTENQALKRAKDGDILYFQVKISENTYAIIKVNPKTKAQELIGNEEDGYTYFTNSTTPQEILKKSLQKEIVFEDNK